MTPAGPLGATASAWLVRLDPRVKLAMVATVSGLSVLVESRAALLSLVAFGVALAANLRLSRGGWAGVALLVGLVLWSNALSQAFFYPAPDAERWWLLAPRQVAGLEFPGLAMSWVGAEWGLVQSLRIVALSLVGLTVCLSTPREQLLAALAVLGLPTALCMTTVVALGFLPLLASEWQGVRTARWLRGYRVRPWRNGWLATLWAEVELLGPLVAGALRRGDRLATSITARGFEVSAERTQYPPLALGRGEVAVLAALALLTSAVACLKLLETSHELGLTLPSALQSCAQVTSVWL